FSLRIMTVSLVVAPQSKKLRILVYSRNIAFLSSSDATSKLMSVNRYVFAYLFFPTRKIPSFQMVWIGIACCTLFGILNFSLSCRMTVFSVLNMLSHRLLFLFSDLVFCQLVIQVLRMEYQILRHEDLTLDPYPQKFLCGHSVIFDKANGRKGSRSQHAHPTDGFHPHMGTEQKIKAHSNTAGQNRTDKLAE